MNSFLERSVDKLEQAIRYELSIILEDIIPEVKEIIIESYRNNLEGVVISDYETIKPEYYEETFIERLDEFEYVREDEDESINFVCPDMENFDFSQGLEFIYNILSGLVGTYYKVHSYKLGYTDEDTMFVVGEGNPILEGIDTKELKIYEFSDNEPINIFVDAEEFVDENINDWISNANKKAVNRFADYHAGVNIYGEQSI